MKKLLHSFFSVLLVCTLTIAPLTNYAAPLVRAEDAPVVQEQTPPPASTPSEAATPVPAATQPPTATAAPAQPATPKPAATAKPPAGGSAYPTASAVPAQPATPRPAKTAIPSVLDATPTPQATAYATPAQGVTTGGQSGNSQTGDASVKTGDANVNGSVVNNANTNISGVSGSGSGNGEAISTNSANGALSDNNAKTNNSSSSDQQLANSANLSNNVEIGAVSGANSASRNTGDGEVVTGDANVGVTVINGANNNISGLAVNQYDVNGNQTGDIVLGSSTPTASCGTGGSACSNGVVGAKSQNTGNGASSDNAASTNTNNNSVTTLSNEADVVNDVVIDAVTGGNKADSNVGSGNVDTGDANVAVTVLNFLNNNIVAGTVDVINIFGDYVGNIIIPQSSSAGAAGNSAAGNNAAGNYVSQNSSNGDSSVNNASTNASNTNTTTQANLADIDNNLDVTANTGNNKAQSNTNGDNSVQSGSTNVDANIYNVANVNSKDGGYIVLVNDNGTWKGTIYGATGDKAASEGVAFVVQPDGTVVASNTGNGTQSDNNAQNNTNNSTATTQINNAKLENNVKINADTGNNSASRNTDGGSIKTGNVNVAASIMNFVNNNFIGQTFRVVLVNVMGKWTGSVVPPGQKAPTPAVGGAQQNSAQANTSTQNTASPTPSATPVAQAAAQKASYASGAPTGAVLGKMTMNKLVTNNGLKNSAEIILDDGQKFYVDDTLAVPQDKPIVAAAVGVNSANTFGNYWVYALGILPLLALGAGFIIRRRKLTNPQI